MLLGPRPRGGPRPVRWHLHRGRWIRMLLGPRPRGGPRPVRWHLHTELLRFQVKGLRCVHGRSLLTGGADLLEDKHAGAEAEEASKAGTGPGEEDDPDHS